jgi:hypothetical protein
LLTPEACLHSRAPQYDSIRDKRIGICGDDCERAKPFSRFGIFPVLPNACDTKRRAILHGDGIRLLRSLSLDCLPIEAAIHRHDAASLPISLAEAVQLRACFGLGIDRFASAGRVRAPIRDKAPPRRVERYFASVMIAPDDEQLLTGRSVLAGRIIADAAIPYIQAMNDGISRRSAALNYTSAHGAQYGSAVS